MTDLLAISGLGERHGQFLHLLFMITFIYILYQQFLFLRQYHNNFKKQLHFKTNKFVCILCLFTITGLTVYIIVAAYLLLMRTDSKTLNNIIPVKSLLENARSSSKKLNIPFSGKDSETAPCNTLQTPKAFPHQNYQNKTPQTQRDNLNINNNAPPRQVFKGISLRKNQCISRTMQTGFHKQMGQTFCLQLQQPKNISKEKKSYQEFVQGKRSTNWVHEKHASQLTQFNNVNKKQYIGSDFACNGRSVHSDRKQTVKTLSFNGFSEEIDKNQSKMIEWMSSKNDEETWNVSKFDKVLHSEKDTHHIFKDDLAKVKTRLFQKQAYLFQTTQLLAQKERQLKQLNIRFQMAVDVNRNMKQKITGVDYQMNQKTDYYNKLLTEKDSLLLELKNTNDKIKQQCLLKERELESIKQNSIKAKEEYERNQQDIKANYMLATLKIRQYQLDQKEKDQIIADLKDKDKRNTQNYEKIINGINELLRQKEQQLLQISQTALLYKKQLSKTQTIVQEDKKNHVLDLFGKEQIIRQLSGEVSDLKNSLRALESHMRELIQSEQQLKRDLENNSCVKNKQLQKIVHNLTQQIEMNNQQAFAQNQIMQNNLKKIKNLQNLLVQNKDQYMKQKTKWTKNLQQKQEMIQTIATINQQFKLQCEDLTANLRKSNDQTEHSQNQVQQLRAKVIQLEEVRVSFRSSQKIQAICKDKKPQDKQMAKLRNINIKLLKDNERFSLIMKQMNIKIYQLHKNNIQLNDEIVLRDIQTLNKQFKEKQEMKE